MSPEDLLRRMGGPGSPVVLDVRSAFEFRAGHVPGAVHLPFWAASLARLPPEVTGDRPVVVYCGHGPRARMARMALRARGLRRIALLAGHMAGWRRKGLPEER